MMIPVKVSLPPITLGLIDKERGDVSRSLWLRRLVEEALYDLEKARQRAEKEKA